MGLDVMFCLLWLLLCLLWLIEPKKPNEPLPNQPTMDQKKGNNGGEKKKKNNGGEGEKKGGDGIITAVSKMDMHREGCASKVNKCVRRFEDLEKPRDMVESKGKKKAELVPPLPKDKKKGGGGGGGGKGQKGEGERQKKAVVEKVEKKEPRVTTAVLELDLHCPRAMEKIKEIITHTKGYVDMKINTQKNWITVAGMTMDMEALADALKKKLRTPVKIVPSMKDDGGNWIDGGKWIERGRGKG